MRVKSNLWHSFVRSGRKSETIHEKYKDQCKLVKSEISSSISNYELELAKNCAKNPKSLFNYINKERPFDLWATEMVPLLQITQKLQKFLMNSLSRCSLLTLVLSRFLETGRSMCVMRMALYNITRLLEGINYPNIYWKIALNNYLLCLKLFLSVVGWRWDPRRVERG